MPFRINKLLKAVAVVAVFFLILMAETVCCGGVAVFGYGFGVFHHRGRFYPHAYYYYHFPQIALGHPVSYRPYGYGYGYPYGISLFG
ncbi:hypothetical protein CHUAL_001970 [Chamberlinius hualienensis]